MSDQTPYTPSSAMARERYAQGVSAFKPARPYPVALAEFDRLIAQVRAEAWDEGRQDGLYDGRARNFVAFKDRPNPYREGQ